jgi:glycosyltransferase involved in cell wall biosynthesis
MASAGRAHRVLVIVQNLPVPFDRRVWLEATTLARAGYQVSVICPKLKGFNASFESIEGVDIYRYAMPLDPKGRLGFVVENLLALLRTFLLTFRVAWRGRGFDVIHACNPPETYWTVGLFWRLFGKRFLFDHHDLSPELFSVKFGGAEGGLLHKVLLLLEKITFKVADVSIATNGSHQRIAIERGGMAPERVFIVRSGPDLGRFCLYPPDPVWKQGKDFLIAFLGEMGDQDGLGILIEALARLKGVRTDFHCVLIGGGTYRSAIMAEAEKVGVADLCTFTGVVSDDDLCRILSSADVGVDPVPLNDWSDRSTMNKIMEYMFFGLPVVAFDLAETRVSAQDAGVYAAPSSAESLAGRISDLLDDPDRRARLSEIGRRRLREELAWEHSAPHLLAAYECLFAC